MYGKHRTGLARLCGGLAIGAKKVTPAPGVTGPECVPCYGGGTAVAGSLGLSHSSLSLSADLRRPTV